MDVKSLQRQFARIGARARVRPLDVRRGTGPVILDIGRDRQGELFEVQISQEAAPDVLVLHAVPRLQHLVLLARTSQDQKHRFLCGHDERHWFVAAIPESRPVNTVRSAMEALKPAQVRFQQQHLHVRTKDRIRRHNAAFVRQGEWFFLPEPQLNVPSTLVLRHEPLRRGGGKPHQVEFLYRSGGESVYVCWRYPNGLTEAQYNTLLSRQPSARRFGWRPMRRNPAVYARGRIRHADHETIHLSDWHRVLMNTESEAAARRHLAFLD